MAMMNEMEYRTILLVSALLNVVQDFVALVDDFVVLSPIGTQRAVGGSVMQILL